MEDVNKFPFKRMHHIYKVKHFEEKFMNTFPFSATFILRKYFIIRRKLHIDENLNWNWVNFSKMYRNRTSLINRDEKGSIVKLWMNPVTY